MTRERIEDMREVVLPFVKKRLLETNYEGLGKSDAEMFAKDFDEILNLAIKALEQEPKTDIKLTNSEWVDFLTKQFDISRTSAKAMLHVMMSVKREDNFKKQFSGRK